MENRVELQPLNGVYAGHGKSTHRISRKPIPSYDYQERPISPSRDDFQDNYDSQQLPTTDHDTTATPKLRKWIPLPLQTKSFLAFAIVYAASFATLEALYRISQSRNGLSTVKASHRYAWTYGPTAVFTLVATFWGQVEYRTKQLFPWRILARGPATAEKTVLLDYVSPWNVPALFSSLKKGHAGVSLAVIGSLLLKLAIVLSTGLFLLREVVVHHDSIPMLATDRFSGDNFSKTSKDKRPALAVMGVKKLGLGVLHGTTETFASQSFNLTGSLGGVTSLGAPVDVFFANLECEVATMSNFSTECRVPRCSTLDHHFSLDSPSCHVEDAFLKFDFNRDNQKYGRLANFNCSNIKDPSEAYRYFISTGVYIQETKANELYGNFTNLLCKPIYRIQRQWLSLGLDGAVSESSPILDSSSPSYKLPNIGAPDIASAMLSSLDEAEAQIKDDNKSGFETYFILLNATISKNESSAYMDPKTLTSASQSVFQFLTSQMAKTSLMVSASEPITGTITRTEQRLYVRELSMRAMEVCCIILLLGTVALWWFAPISDTSHDPSSLEGLALILARSKELNGLFKNTGMFSLIQLKRSLRSTLYSTRTSRTNGEGTCIEIASSSNNNGSRTNELYSEDAPHRGFWHPLSHKWPVMIAVPAIPLMIVAALEVLYQQSNRNNGLATIRSDGYVRYSWVYIPAVVMLLIQALYSIVDFSTRVLSPYHQMRKTASPAPKSVLVNYLSVVTLQSLFTALRNQHWAVVFANVTMFIAPFLTIISSGLYFTRQLPMQQNIELQPLSAFNMSANFSMYYPAPSAPLVINLIVKSNLSYPDGTYKDLVFPKFELPSAMLSGSNATSGNATSIRVEMPVLRPFLNCTRSTNVTGAYDVGRGLYSIKKGVYERYAIGSVTVGGPGNCSTTNSLGGFQGSTAADEDYSEKYYYIYDQLARSKKPNCPEIYGVYGIYTKDLQVRTTEDLRAEVPGIVGFSCSPALYELQAAANFTLPDLKVISIDTDETTAKLIPRKQYSILWQDIFPSYWSSPNRMDGNYVAAIDNANPADWVGETNWPKMNDRLEYLYRIAYSQSMNLAGRIPASKENSSPLQATVFFPSTDESRLIQDGTSTRVLEALLVVMSACAVLAYCLLSVRELVAVQPGSIAAAAALIAESEMVRESAVVRVGNGRKGFGRVFEGYLFSLGWWDKRDGGGESRYGIDIGNAQTYR